MAAPRTWEKGLYLVLNRSKHYITRWNPQLSANLTAPQYACVQDLLTAILACLALLVPPA
jgi:hypothetical protein